MTDFASLLVPDRGQKARPIHLVDKNSFDGWVKKRPAEDRVLLEALRFDGKSAYAFAILPRGNEFEVVSAVKNIGELSPWCLAALAEKLPRAATSWSDGEPGKAALGWLLAPAPLRRLSFQEGPGTWAASARDRGSRARSTKWFAWPKATALVRDLVNTPAADMGPAELEKAASDLAERSAAQADGHGAAKNSRRAIH